MRMNTILKTILAGTVASSLIILPVSASAAFGTVYADYLTVRTSPSTSGEAVAMLTWGDEVELTYDCGGGWYEIFLGGTCYYVNGDFIYTDAEDIDGTTYNTTDSYTANDAYTSDYADYSAYSGYDDYSDSYGYSESYDYGTQTYEEVYDTTYEETSEGTSSYEAEETSQGTYLGTFTLTAYCGCASCCGTAGNLTASGTVPTAGRTVAMGGVPFGTKLLINGTIYTVEDRGTSYGVVDIFVNSHSEAISFGMQSAEVYQID